MRFQILDAIGSGNHPFQRRGDEAAHQFGAGPGVDRGDGDAGIIVARVQHADS